MAKPNPLGPKAADPAPDPAATPDPIAAEVESPDVAHVAWRGIEFDVPRNRDEWPFRGIVALETGRTSVAIRSFLPDEAYGKFLALNPKGKDADEIFVALLDALGIGSPGE